MGKGANTTTNQSSSSNTSTTSPNAQAAGVYSDLLNRATGVANTPYQSYTGELVAPVNAQQQLGVAGLNANAGFASPYIQNAAGLVQNAANPLTQSQIQQYYSPYQQSVINATQAQFNNQNAQTAARIQGNAISQGALGGNRVGVAQGIAAGQEALAQAPVIANLQNQGYQNALQTAQQQFQTLPMNAAYQLGNLGVAGQNAALQGAQAQIGAGGLYQNTQQAQDQAAYQQFLQQQGYPFQTTQWLAGVAGGLGPLLGSTTTGQGQSQGQTTAPPPNLWNSIIGAAGTLGGAAIMASDRRVKENIKRIGKLNDGQIIYRYNYKGDPQTQIGLIAQEVEKNHPDAVHDIGDGLKGVDYRAATEDSVGGRAQGGVVRGYDGGGVVPYAGAPSWVPVISMSPHALQGHSYQATPSTAPGVANTSEPNADKITGQVMDLTKKWKNSPSDTTMGSPGVTDALPVVGAAGDYAVPTFMAHGGVAGYADGDSPVDDPSTTGVVGLSPEALRAYAYRIGAVPDVGSSPQLSFADRAQPTTDAIAGGDFDPQGANYTDFGTPKFASGVVPLPQARPDSAPQVASNDDDEEDSLPAAITNPRGGVAAPAEGGVGVASPAMAFNRDDAQAGFAPSSATTPENTFLGFNRPNLGMALMTAGLRMMASRSPYLGQAIGEGGLAGVGAYTSAQAAQAKQAQEDRRIDMEAQRLAQEADRTAKDLQLRGATQAETIRHNKATEANAADKAPSGYQKAPDGSLVYIKGGPHDPDQIAAETSARTKKGTELDDDTVDAIAQRVAQGDTRAIVGLGRNPAAIAQIQKRTAEIFKEQGLDHEAGAKAILANVADQAGRMTAERTQAGIAAKLAVFGRNVDNAIGVATKASEDANRTQFTPVNVALNAFRTNTGDPKIVALGQSLNTLTNEYARAVGQGHGTVHDKEQAEQQLNQARSHQQLVAIMNIMRQEVQMTKKSMPEARQEMRELYSRPSSETLRPGAAVPATTPAAPAATPKRVIQNGYTYEQGPDGQYRPVQ